MLSVAIGGLILAAATIPLVAAADTETSNTTLNLTVNPVLISYSSGPTVTLGAITPNGTGTQSTAADTVAANTNDTSGLTITLQENSAVTTAMVSGSNTISAGSGTEAAPATLTNGQWGWRMDGVAGFGSGPTSTLNNASPSALTFAAIPANASPYTIVTTSTNGSSSSSVWYSARVNDTQPVGTYSTTVTYTFSTN